MKIDFREKKTENGWQESFDAFWIKITPGWFDVPPLFVPLFMLVQVDKTG